MKLAAGLGPHALVRDQKRIFDMPHATLALGHGVFSKNRQRQDAGAVGVGPDQEPQRADRLGLAGTAAGAYLLRGQHGCSPIGWTELRDLTSQPDRGIIRQVGYRVDRN